MEIKDLLRNMVDCHASDMHLKAMRPPLLRIDKKLIPDGTTQLSPDDIRRMLLPLLNENQRTKLEENLWVDLAYSLSGVSRFRVSITHQRGTLAASFRRIPFEFPSLDDWGLPSVIKDFTDLQSGLVLITGPTGSGKSSTLAALLRLICRTHPVHLVTIEDPIEFLLQDDVGAISQRELGTDTLSFHDALRNVLRQDPDVIVIGEMRDPETMATAITAAETGHLIFSTLHTNCASQTIDRVIDAFPSSQQDQVRTQLSQVMQGIVSLKLVKRCDEPGLTAAVEILKNTPRISKLIAEGNTAEIEAEMENSVAFYKMQTMNQSLTALTLNGVISVEEAKNASHKPDDLERELRKFLFASQAEGSGGLDMSKADFSKITELQEVQRLYDEAQERYASAIAEKDRIIQEMQAELEGHEGRMQEVSAVARQAQDSIERARRETEAVKQNLEAKVKQLQARVKELSATETQGGKRGFFSR
jgi:twitching motility protein PilT